MIEFLQRKRGLHFSKVTVLFPDQYAGGSSPSLKILEGGLEELRFSLHPLRGEHPGIEPSLAVSRITPYFRRWKLRYDYCVTADLTGWQIAYPLRSLGYVSSIVYDDQDYFPRIIKSLPGRLTSLGLENIIAKSADAVVSASDTLAKLRRRQGARKVFVIPNGVDPSFYRLGDLDVEARLARRTIIYAGYLHRDYGVSLLLEAFSKLLRTMEARLVLAGEGPMTGNLKKELQGGGLDSRVHFLGAVEHEKLADFLNRSTVGVAPYLEGTSAAYGVPMKIKEYLATGLPVIASAVGEIPKFLDGKHAGATIKPDADELAEALGQVLSSDPSAYSAMSLAARSLAEGYSWDDLFDQFFQILLEQIN